ncbi:MAG: hypothetical protein WAO93_04810 [Orrella sp.]
MKGFLQVALLVLTTAVMPLASAQPNMVGVWVQEGDAAGARAGLSNSGHHSANAKTPPKYTHQPKRQWRLEVTEQEGRALHAKWCSENKCESVVGAFRGNGDLLLVDEDGLFIGSVEAGKLELCYLETGKSYQVASCMDFIKQK